MTATTTSTGRSACGGELPPGERAAELHSYALRHITNRRFAALEDGKRSLYRIFYYDCPPVENLSVWQPWDGKNLVFNSKTKQSIWKASFLEALGEKRKVALRLGTVTAGSPYYSVKKESMLALFSGRKALGDLGKGDFRLEGMKQSGVDMRIGLDVASMSMAGIVDQIVLVAGDADFVPALKFARRAGVDFLVDPMGNDRIRRELVEQSDGVEDMTRE